MVNLVQRRKATVEFTKQLLSAVTYVRQQKQIPNVDRICKYVHRTHHIPYSECCRQLNDAVEDGFIAEYTAIGFKGSRTGLEQEGYRLVPADEVAAARDGHDWYCFECHGPGEMVLCSECFRCFHTHCAVEDTCGEKFTCAICKAGKQKNSMKKKMLNTLLSYTILRLRDKAKELHKISTKSEDEMLSRFVYNDVDLTLMDSKVIASKYRSLDEFCGDALNIHHNCVLLFGDDGGPLVELSKEMLRYCKYDLDEIELCANCYYMSNAKPEQWFCQPCNPPHDLVYAKLKGFGYWPAKVINEVDGTMDVRFFGGWHQRADIPAEFIRPITTDLDAIVVKRTGGFNKACKELQTHQHLLEERENELQEQAFDRRDRHDDDDDDDGGESFQLHTPMACDVEDMDMTRQVTSTSIDPKHKRKSSILMSSTLDESLVVTSSVDKVSAKRKRSLPRQSRLAANTQMANVTTDAISQTELEETKDIATMDRDVMFSEGVERKRCVSPPTVGISEAECQERVQQAVTEVSERLDLLYGEEKSKALKELSDRLKKDFEEDKQTAVLRATGNVDKVRKTTEEKCKAEYMEEMKKLAAKHKEAISTTKRKQWCYHCEEEAMYHCCWNTSYCSVCCQQVHWHKEHKRVCRRKRAMDDKQ